MRPFLIRHASRQLPLFESGDLSANAAARVERHLAQCPRCRRELDDIRFAARLMRQVAVVPAPDRVWTEIEARLRPIGRPSSPPAPVLTRDWRWAGVVAALVLVAAAGYMLTGRFVAEPWTVTMAGQAAAQAVGDWVETSPSSPARIQVGDIGTVDVEPSSRVRLGTASNAQYRLELARGTIHARISAPPRLFILDTPASTVVDLGCAYTVTVDEAGTGLIHVTEGWTALEWPARESLVPAGAFCRIRPRIGPGVPYFADAPERLRRALEAWDSEGAGSPALADVLAAARPRDTLSLWHLLSRVAPEERVLIADRIVELVPLPATVSRERALALDADALRLWREELAWKW